MTSTKEGEEENAHREQQQEQQQQRQQQQEEEPEESSNNSRSHDHTAPKRSLGKPFLSSSFHNNISCDEENLAGNPPRKVLKREWLAYPGRRHPRVGNEYQVPALPALIRPSQPAE